MKKKLFLGLFVISLILTMFSASHGAEVIKLTFISSSNIFDCGTGKPVLR
jgi:hypothetical protein